MKRLFSRRTNEKVDALIDPYTFEADNDGNDLQTQEIMMGHTHGPAFQDISIGTSRKRPLLRRSRMMSLESDFRISRVDLSPLTQDDTDAQKQSEISKMHRKFHHTISRQTSNVSFAHPYAAEMENYRDISSAARAYLPNSTSLLTTTTSHARLHDGQINSNPSSFQLNSKPSGELNSWPSSILMHPLNTLPQKPNASSPIRRKAPPSDQISWRESLEQQLGLNRGIEEKDTFDHTGHFSDLDSEARSSTLRSSTLAMHRKRSVPVLRGVSHANRQRQSMLLSLAQDEPEVDEFGQLIKPIASKQKPYSTTVIAKTGIATQNDCKSDLFSSQRSAKSPKPNNNRDTFGIFVEECKRTAPELEYSLPRTPPPLVKIDALGCPPTLGLDTPALIGTQSTFGETPRRKLKRDFSHTSNSSSRSTRSRLRINETKEIILHPSPHSSTFRFPALCVAAMDRAEAMVDALASPHYTDKAQLGIHSPSISLASARFERPTNAISDVYEEQNHDKLALLGSPIKLTSEEPAGKQSHLKSKFSSSDSSFVQHHFDEKENKVEIPKKNLMKETKSDTYLNTMTRLPKPRSLFESESMPIVRLETNDQMPATPQRRVAKNVTRDQEEAQVTQAEEARVAEMNTPPKSSLVVSSIIEQQEEAMQRLRRSSKWTTAKIENPSPALERRSHSSWTHAASSDVEMDVQSDQEIQDPSSMDKCVDWECNAVTYDSNAFLNPAIMGTYRSPNSSTGNESQIKASSDESHVQLIQKKTFLVDKATQTETCPPPRPVRNEARRADLKSHSKAVTPTKPPDICILLASPRRGDDENPLDGLSFNVGLGIITNEENNDEGKMDETLLTPRAIDDTYYMTDGTNTTLEVFEQEMDALIETLSSTFTPISKKYNEVSLSPEFEERSTEIIKSPPSLSSSTTVTIFQTPRESTTTATIEAMIEQSRVAQRTPERLVLNKGGRRHENKAKQISTTQMK